MNISISVNCPDDIEIVSYAGAFSQVITNLIINSLIHGFIGKDNGKIEFDVCHEKNGLLFRYRDDGWGMEEDVVEKILAVQKAGIINPKVDTFGNFLAAIGRDFISKKSYSLLGTYETI